MQNNKLNFAAIDVGSNAVRLLIKSVNAGDPPERLTKTVLLRVPLRLGEEVFSVGEISASKKKQLLRTMKAFRQLMKVYDVESYRACATSAMRDAANGEKIVREIHNKTGIKLEIIDGQEEARMIYDSHIADLLGHDGHYIYVDVGGGSTEISLISQGQFGVFRVLQHRYGTFVGRYGEKGGLGDAASRSVGTVGRLSRSEDHRLGRKHRKALPFEGGQGRQLSEGFGLGKVLRRVEEDVGGGSYSEVPVQS